jgi:hypothetical protein
LVEEVKPAAKTGVRVPPKSRSKGKDKDGNVAPRRSLAGLAPAHG